jgi:hypothetical protein
MKARDVMVSPVITVTPNSAPLSVRASARHPAKHGQEALYP